jgi:hypothetical protein
MFVDVYGSGTSIGEAICDDVRATLPEGGASFPLINQASGLEAAGCSLEIERLIGPERPDIAASFDGLKRNWRVMRLQVLLTHSD